MRSMGYLAVAAATLTLAGCASVQVGDPAKNAEVKKFESKANMGQVYVCRDGSMFGMAIRPDIELDGKMIGTVARGTYAYQEVSPGDHTLNVKSLEHDSKIPFTIAAGEQKFFQTWISMGVVAGRGIIDVMEPAKGKECVAGGDLIEVSAK